jgi:ribosomal protein L37AE/L43A
MSLSGCPKCGRTPIIYSTTTRWWSCKSCKHMWLDEMTPAAKAGIARKATVRAAVAPRKQAKAKKKAGKKKP